MLEIREYKIAELRDIFETRDRQGIRRKLTRYGCKFEETGRGEGVVFNILSAPDEFKVFCITEMNVPAQADFRRMKMFYYAFFEDEDFMNMPDVDKEKYMSDEYEAVSRQTIRNWIRYLERANLIYRDKFECNYYAINKRSNGDRVVTEISRETYKEGWDVYWKNNKPEESDFAFLAAMEVWGGAVCRTPKNLINGIEWNKIERLKNIIINSIFEE